MKRWMQGLVCVTLLVMSVSSYASVRSTIADYARKSGLNVGIVIRSLQNGKIYYQRNASRFYIPGSNVKVLTAAASLAYLGPNYQFITRLFVSNKAVTRGVLNGDVYLDYSGDPTLRIRDIDQMIKALKSLGVNRIRGHFYIDQYAYDQDDRAPGWNPNDFQYCFSAPINAAIVNNNCISYVVRPGAKQGYRVRARVANRYMNFIQFDNRAVTRLSRRSCPPLTASISKTNTIVLRGCLLKGAKPVGLSNSVMSVTAFNIAMVKSLLQRNDIRVTQGVAVGRIRKGLTLISHHASNALSQLDKVMMKKSDNLYASAIYKKLGQRVSGESASWQNSSAAVKTILRNRLGVNLNGAVIIDGSGLSHNNRLSPAELVSLLTGVYRNAKMKSVFINTLPISGVDGTLKYRMSGNMRRRVNAKTGTLNGVSTLSGYLNARRYGPLVFSIMVNGYSGSPARARQLIDKILTYVGTR